MEIPFARPHMDEAEIAAVAEVIRSGWVTQGPKVAQFEQAVADFVGAGYGIATTSCTTGLHLALATAGVGARPTIDRRTSGSSARMSGSTSRQK